MTIAALPVVCDDSADAAGTGAEDDPFTGSFELEGIVPGEYWVKVGTQFSQWTGGLGFIDEYDGTFIEEISDYKEYRFIAVGVTTYSWTVGAHGEMMSYVFHIVDDFVPLTFLSSPVEGRVIFVS